MLGQELRRHAFDFFIGDNQWSEPELEFIIGPHGQKHGGRHHDDRMVNSKAEHALVPCRRYKGRIILNWDYSKVELSLSAQILWKTARDQESPHRCLPETDGASA